MKILVTGASGMLGHKLVQRLSSRFEVFGSIRSVFADVERYGIFDKRRTFEQIDLLDDDSLRRVIERLRPDVVINAAGVIKQLPSSKNVVNTLMINSILPHKLRTIRDDHGFKLITVSTDCVFSGEKGNHSENDPADALDLYGRSKNLGEVSGAGCLTIRTSIIGRELESSHSLVEWFLGNRGQKVKGFRRAIYSGFPTIVFADIIADLLVGHPDLEGLFHISSDPIDKFGLLLLINEAYRAGIDVEPDDSFVIDRSLDSSKFRKVTGFHPPSWKTMIDTMAADPTPYDKFRK